MDKRRFTPDGSRERIPISRARVAHAHATARELRRRATPSEAVLWSELRGEQFRRWRFRRQHPIGPYIVDFFSSRASLIVEIDGPVHDSQTEYDAERQAELEGAGYRVLRLTAERVTDDVVGALSVIEAVLAGRSTHQPPDKV